MTNKYITAMATAFDINEEVAVELTKDKLKKNNLMGFEEVITTQPINGKTATEVKDALTTPYKVYGEVKQRSLRVSSFLKRFNKGTYIIVTGNDTSTVIDGTVLDNSTSGKALVRKVYKIA